MAPTSSNTSGVQHHYRPSFLLAPPPGPAPDRPLPTPPGPPGSAVRADPARASSHHQTPNTDDVATEVGLGIQDDGHGGRDALSLPQPKDGASSNKKHAGGHESTPFDREDVKADAISSDGPVLSAASRGAPTLPGPSLSGTSAGFHFPVA